MAADPSTGMPAFDDMRTNADHAYQTALDTIKAQRANLYSQYGYSPDGTLDHLNPYGAIQSADYNDGMNMLGDMQAQAGRGIGQGGLANQRQQLLKFMHARNITGLGTNFLGANSGLDSQAAGAVNTHDTAYTDIGNQEAAWNWANTMNNPPSVDPTTAGAVADAPPGWTGSAAGYRPPSGFGRFVLD